MTNNNKICSSLKLLHVGWCGSPTDCLLFLCLLHVCCILVLMGRNICILGQDYIYKPNHTYTCKTWFIISSPMQWSKHKDNDEERYTYIVNTLPWSHFKMEGRKKCEQTVLYTTWNLLDNILNHFEYFT